MRAGRHPGVLSGVYVRGHPGCCSDRRREASPANRRSALRVGAERTFCSLTQMSCFGAGGRGVDAGRKPRPQWWMRDHSSAMHRFADRFPSCARAGRAVGLEDSTLFRRSFASGVWATTPMTWTASWTSLSGRPETSGTAGAASALSGCARNPGELKRSLQRQLSERCASSSR